LKSRRKKRRLRDVDPLPKKIILSQYLDVLQVYLHSSIKGIIIMLTQSEAISRLKKELSWPDMQVQIGIRAGFRCEYCGKDLLASYEDYDLWQVDHIIPNGDNGIENLALSCKFCNFVKRATDPSMTAKSNQREDLIGAAKEIIQARRKQKEIVFVRTLEAVAALR